MQYKTIIVYNFIFHTFKHCVRYVFRIKFGAPLSTALKNGYLPFPMVVSIQTLYTYKYRNYNDSIGYWVFLVEYVSDLVNVWLFINPHSNSGTGGYQTVNKSLSNYVYSFPSHSKGTCNTRSLWTVDLHDIFFVKPCSGIYHIHF